MNENKDLDLNDKNAIERNNVLTNPWYPNNSNIDRRISSVPYNMFILDSMDVGLELIDWNEPRKFHGVVFIKDEYVAKTMRDFYYKIWDIAALFFHLPSNNNNSDNRKAACNEKFYYL